MLQTGRQLSGKFFGAVAWSRCLSLSQTLSPVRTTFRVWSVNPMRRLSHTLPPDLIRHAKRADRLRLMLLQLSRMFRLANIHQPSNTRLMDRRDTDCSAAK